MPAMAPESHGKPRCGYEEKSNKIYHHFLPPWSNGSENNESIREGQSHQFEPAIRQEVFYVGTNGFKIHLQPWQGAHLAPGCWAGGRLA